MPYTVTQLTPNQHPDWDNFVINHPHGQFTQTSAWAQLKQKYGWQPQLWVIQHQQAIIAGAFVHQRPLPLGQSLQYIPFGPLAHPDHPQALTALINHLKQQAQGSIYLQIEPPTHHDQLAELLPSPISRMIQPERTLILDLSQSEDQLQAGMRQTTRRYIRQAQKQGLTTNHFTSDQGLDQFYDIMQQVHQRKKFGIHIKQYYRDICHLFDQLTQQTNQPATVHIITINQGPDLLGAYFLLQIAHKSWELYGGTSHQGLKLRANYLLKWHSITAMKQAGVISYDQWGIAPNDDPKHYLAGVTYFKQGFAGHQIDRPGAYIHTNKPLLYTLAKLTRKV